MLQNDVLSPTLIRGSCLLLPIILYLALWVLRHPSQKETFASLLASLWVLTSIVSLQGLVNYFDWWVFQAQGGVLFSIPIDLLLGWSLLWGAIPFFISKHLRLPFWLLIIFIFDLFFMPTCTPVLQLKENWVTGEIVFLLSCFLPAQLLAIWTNEDRNLFIRTFLQLICFSTLFVFILPLIIFEQLGGSWNILFTRPIWLNNLNFQLLAIPLLLGISAVQEFVLRGYGTPVPYDPPKRLVTSGFYRYIANPMQLSTALFLFGYGMMLNHFWLFFSGFVAFAYGAGIANWDEKQDLNLRFGKSWLEYRKNVRNWLPNWRPWHSIENKDSWPTPKLYFDESCSQCSQLAQWFKARNPLGLTLIPAQEHPKWDLRRLTYDPCDGAPEEEGVCAFARGLEHINFAWAFIGAFMRLPLIHQFLQIISDATGGEPKQVCRRKS